MTDAETREVRELAELADKLAWELDEDWPRGIGILFPMRIAEKLGELRVRLHCLNRGAK